MQQIRSLSQTDEKKAGGLNSAQSTGAADVFFANPSQPAVDLPLSPRPESQTVLSKDQFTATVAEKSLPSTASTTHTSLHNVSQAVPGSIRSAERFIIIPADKKRKKTAPGADAPARHLSPRLRQIILLVTIVIIGGGTLGTLVPLATGQTSFNFFSGLSILINHSQSSLQIQAQQTQAASHAQPAPMVLSHSQYVAIAEQDATNAGIPPTYFVRQIQLESGFNPNAVSPSGAVGIAQFLPSTAAGLGIDPWDPIQALQGAAKLMANYYHQYGDYAKALAAYNAGSANLNNAIKSCGSNWLSCMPAQTQNYVATIMG